MVEICTAVTTLDTTNADQTDPANAREPACQITTGPSTCRSGSIDSCVSQAISPTIKHASWFRIRYCIHACCAVTLRFYLGFGIQIPESAVSSVTYNGWRNVDDISISATDGFTSGSEIRNLCLGGLFEGRDGSLTDVDHWMVHVTSVTNCEDDSVAKFKFCLEWACSCDGSDDTQSWIPTSEQICGSVTVV